MSDRGPILERILGEEFSDRPAAAALRVAGETFSATSASVREPAIFPIYSIAKMLIAAVILQLRDEKKLSLEDRLSAWHPEVPGAGEIALRMVLQHRAGLRDYGPLREYHEALAASPQQAWSRSEYAARTWDRGLLSEPGTEFAYSNPGYRLVREIAEQVEGSSFAELVLRRIRDPLELENTRALVTASDFALAEPGLSTRLGGSEIEARDVREAMDPDWVFPGTLLSSAPETLRLLTALAEGRLVSRSSLEEMLVLHSAGRQEGYVDPSYGLGVMGDPRSPFGLVWGHNGGGPGYSAAAWHAPEHPAGPVSCVVLCASESPLADAALDRILRSSTPP